MSEGDSTPALVGDQPEKGQKVHEKGKGHLKKAERLLRDQEAVRLKCVEGIGYRDIAEKLGYHDASSAQKAVTRTLGRDLQANVEHYRQLHMDTLQSWLEKLAPLIAGEMQEVEEVETDTDGEKSTHSIAKRRKKQQLDATNTGLKILAEMRKYVGGLEVPSKVEASGPAGGPFVINMMMPQPNNEIAPVKQDEL